MSPRESAALDPMPMPDVETDFVDGIVTIAGNGDSFAQTELRLIFTAPHAGMTTAFFTMPTANDIVRKKEGSEF